MLHDISVLSAEFRGKWSIKHIQGWQYLRSASRIWRLFHIWLWLGRQSELMQTFRNQIRENVDCEIKNLIDSHYDTYMGAQE